MSTFLGWTYDGCNPHHRLFRALAISSVSAVCFVLAWWDVSLVLGSPAVPTPAETWGALADLVRNGDALTGRTLGDYVGSSLRTLLLGFALALALAVPLGLAIGRSGTVGEFAMPVIEILRPIAPIAWAPILILAVGYTTGPVLVVSVGIFFPVLTNTVFGARNVDPLLIDMSRTFGASRAQVFTKIVVPSAVPSIMNGIRIGLGIGWMCIVAAELYAPQLSGIGFYLSEQATMGCWPSAFAAVAVIAALGLLTAGGADRVHRAVARRMGADV